MQKIREALAAGERGDQTRLEQMRCVDQSTVSTWKAACELLDAVEGKHDLSHVCIFQPTHAREIVRRFRREHGPAKNWTENVKEAIADWVDRCEKEKLTMQELKQALLEPTAPLAITSPRIVTDLQTLIDAGERFSTFYADPPWQYGNQATRAATDNHYLTMTVEEIAALPIPQLTEERAHLWLWTTNGFLFECPKIFAAWGFEFKSSFVWCKPQIGIGNYLRNAHEFLLLAVRGGLTGAAKNVRSWEIFDRREHSSKPEQIRKIVERVSPPARLEMFGRRLADGWTVWGNQVETTMFDDDVIKMEAAS